MNRPQILPDDSPAHGPAPIGDYGLLGDTRTAAMVSSDGAIDWLCLPRFDGEPVFGRMVGGPAAGTFRVGPLLPATVVERRYRNDGTTLETTWTVGQGRLVLTEAIVAQRELLIHVDPGAAWELIVEDEARWRTWSAQIDDCLP